jgi:hypothetical protein
MRSERSKKGEEGYKPTVSVKHHPKLATSLRLKLLTTAPESLKT